MDEKQKLLQAIALQETLRGVVDDEIIDIAVATLRQRLATLNTGVTAKQRKQVTIFFADLVNFVALASDLDPEEVSAIQRAYFQCCNRFIGQYGGQVEKYIGDAVMAVFGIPSLHEQDPENTVRAALEIQRATATLNDSLNLKTPLRVRIGINTGQVFINYRGEGDFNVVGDVVNIAKRLEESAPPGGILIDHNTYGHIRHLFPLEQQPPLLIKGRTEPVQSYLVKGFGKSIPPKPSYKTAAGQIPMIGREEELSRLVDVLARVNETNSFNLSLIMGDGGLGKTRLLREFIQSLNRDQEEQQSKLFQVQTDWQSRFTPYRLLYKLFATYFNLRENERVANRQKLVDGMVALLGPEGEEKAHFIGQLIGLDFSRGTYISGIRTDSVQIYGRAMHYLSQFLAQVINGKPLIIVLEDIQWADNGSLNMITEIAKRCRHLPIFLICTARPQLLEKERDFLDALSPYDLLELQPLKPKESKRLSEVILRRVADLPPLLLKKIVDNAGGNPYYVEELVWMLIEDNIIYEDGLYWWVDQERLEELRIPPTLTGVLQARLDRLSDEERQVLQMAAAIGRNFWDATIDYLLSEQEYLFKQSALILARLSQRDLIRPLHESGNGNGNGSHNIIGKVANKPTDNLREYTFQHPLLQEVTYNSILKANRRLVHHQIADWFVKQEKDGHIEAYAAMIARHYELAGDLQKAATWFGKAARFARDGHVYQEALQNYDRAIKLLPPEITTADRIPLYDGLGLMQVTQLQYDEALITFQVMLAEADVNGDLEGQVTAWLRLSFVYFNIGNNRKALSSANRAEQIIREENLDLPAALSRTLSRKCSALLYLGQIQESLDVGHKALKMAWELEDNFLIPLILGTLYLCFKALGNHKEAERYVKDGLIIEEELGNLASAARSINSLGELARLQGDFDQAGTYYHRAYLTLEQIGDITYAMIVLSNLGGVMVATGKFEAALIPLSEVISKVGSRWLALPETYRFLAEAYLGLDSGPEALEAVRISMKLSSLQDNPEYIGHAWRVLALVACHLGRSVTLEEQGENERYSADDAFQHSTAVFQQTAMKRDLALTYWDWGNCDQARSHSRSARERWQKAREIFRELDLPILIQKLDTTLAAPHESA